MRPASPLVSRLTVLRHRLRRAGIEIGAHAQLSPRARLDGDRIRIGSHCQIHGGAVLATYGGSIELGDHVSVNPYSILYGHGGLEIGDYVRIAAHVVIVSADHVFDDPARPIGSQGLRRERVRIGRDVWVGAHATIVAGVTVGDGAVIGAGSVVTADVPPYTVVAGSPARVIRERGSRPALVAHG